MWVDYWGAKGMLPPLSNYWGGPGPPAPPPLFLRLCLSLLLSASSSFSFHCVLKVCLETWPNHLNFRFLTRIRSPSYFPMAAWIFLRTSSLVTLSLYEMFNSLRKHLISKACVLFSNSAVKVHDSQVYRTMVMSRERISFTFEPRDMLLSFQMSFSFDRAAVAYAILERIADLEPSSETIAPRSLKLVTVPSFCPSTFISLWMPLVLFVISLVFSALFSIIYLVQVLSRHSTRASSSCSSSARASMSSANRRLVIFLPPMLIFPSCSSRA